MITATLILATLRELYFDILLGLDYAACGLVRMMYSLFEIFGGIHKVYVVDGAGNKTYDYLINIFFSNSSINYVFWGMALIGIVLCFGFTIMAVVKKIFDIDDKMKSSLGSILTNTVKSIVTILLINFIVIAILNVSNTLMQSIVQLFEVAESNAQPSEIEFDEEDYATMARILNTIGNYSLNPSRESKYNINACFNDIREDLQRLQRKGVFDFSYEPADGKKDAAPSWQFALVNIAKAHSLTEAQPIDADDKDLTSAITDCMGYMEKYPDFVPLTKYTSTTQKLGQTNIPIDVIIFLAGSTTAAKNEAYNSNVSIYDNLRYDYIKPDGKNMYNPVTFRRDFDIYAYDHWMVIIMALFIAYLFLNLVINCAARIFNMILLYIMAPPFIAVTPFDEGEKAKQWWTAFIIQTFSVFGSVIAIRLLIMFIPIIFSSNLVLSETAVFNYMAKVLMLIALSVAVEQASKLVTGILANNAGMQSLYASDVGGAAMGRLKSLGSAVGSITGAKAGANWLGSKFKHSGLGSWMGMGRFSKEGLERAQQEKEREQKEKDKAATANKEGGKEGAAGSSGGSPKAETTAPITMASQGGFSIGPGSSGGTSSKTSTQGGAAKSNLTPSKQSSSSAPTSARNANNLSISSQGNNMSFEGNSKTKTIPKGTGLTNNASPTKIDLNPPK